MEQKAIPIGVEFYKDIVDKPYYYIDKTLLVKELIDNCSKVTLFTRPRRFGKTLALSMLRTFFEQEMNCNGEIVDNSAYFKDTMIANEGEAYSKHMGKYPVITLSLKSAKQPDFEMAYQCMVQDIAYEYDRHSYVLCGNVLSGTQKDIYKRIMDRQGERVQCKSSNMSTGKQKSPHFSGD